LRYDLKDFGESTAHVKFSNFCLKISDLWTKTNHILNVTKNE